MAEIPVELIGHRDISDKAYAEQVGRIDWKPIQEANFKAGDWVALMRPNGSYTLPARASVVDAKTYLSAVREPYHTHYAILPAPIRVHS